MSDPKFQLRFVNIQGERYLRLDDVAAFIRELGGGEETDVRNRLNEAADNLWRAKVQPRRLGWTLQYERALYRTPKDLIEDAITPEIVARERAELKAKSLLVTEFIVEMDELLREAKVTQATDAHGRIIELYYSDLMPRLKDAIGLVNDRIARRALGKKR